MYLGFPRRILVSFGRKGNIEQSVVHEPNIEKQCRVQTAESLLQQSHLQLLKAAGAAAGLAPERPREVDDLLPHVVGQPDVEGADGAAALPRAAVRLLLRLVDRLAHHVQHRVLVVRLEPREGLQHLHLLLDQHLVEKYIW